MECNKLYASFLYDYTEIRNCFHIVHYKMLSVSNAVYCILYTTSALHTCIAVPYKHKTLLFLINISTIFNTAQHIFD